MAAWNLYGKGQREDFERSLAPEALADRLERYREVFSAMDEEFTLQDLLRIDEMRSRALVAEAISNFPEYLLDQIGKASADGVRLQHNVHFEGVMIKSDDTSFDEVPD